MFRNNKKWMAASLASALIGIPAIAQQYPPQQQQQQYPPQQQQYPPPQQQYPPQGQPQDPLYNQPQQANFPPEQLDSLVARIALYPDPLLAQIFAAATFPDQIQAAAQWSDQHHYMAPQDLANAIQNDQLGFDPSVTALLPFPSVLQMMASDMVWTQSLGAAFATQGPMLQDSVQRMRNQAYNNGYLKSNDQIVVNNNGGYYDIEPYNPGYIAVPYYDPAVVYYRPWRPGGFGISFGYGVGIGGYFAPWGWGASRFAWDRHEVFINNRPWARGGYVGGYRDGDRGRGFYGGGDRGREVYRGEVRGVDRGGAYRGEDRVGDRGGSVGRSGGAPAYRPEANRGPVATPSRPEPHMLQGRSGGERRAAETGRPAPREVHGSGGGGGARGGERHR